MPLWSADHVFDGHHFLSPGVVIETDDSGKILQLLPQPDGRAVQHLTGLMMPGMINAHCHLELSHMKGLIPEKIGLVNFLLAVLELRRGVFSSEQKQEAILQAEKEMLRAGIVAVGDISNTDDTLSKKSEERLYYHTFVECLGLRSEQAEEITNRAGVLRDAFSQHGRSSLVLHAPYTLSDELIALVDQQSAGKITSIHNQETAAENELFLSKTGDFLRLFDAIGFDAGLFKIAGRNSLRSILPKFERQQHIILVHNTFTAADDIQWTKALDKQIWWCLCPNANQYIEDALPDIPMMMANGCRLVLGTDSLASNHQLSILDEMRVIQKKFPLIPVENILQWATSNGASALSIDDRFGSLSAGKSPGILLLPHFNRSDPFSGLNEVQRLY